jgi:hypothetical protein
MSRCVSTRVAPRTMPIHDHPLAVWLRGLPILASPGGFTMSVWCVFVCGIVTLPIRHAAAFPWLNAQWRSMLQRAWVTPFLQAVLLIVARLPCLAFEYELQQDESQMAAQAITLLSDPVFYQSVEGGSGGPLLSYMLWLPRVCLQDINYFTVRIVGLLLWWLTVLGLFLTVRRAAGLLAADVSSWAVMGTYALATQLDFMSYQSELVPAACVSWACFALVALTNGGHDKRAWALLLGVLCGAIPLAKLQGVPLGLVLAALGYGAIAVDRQLATWWRIQTAAWLTCGGLTVPTAFASLFLATGVWERFVRLYLGYGLGYVAAASPRNGLFARYPFLPFAQREIGWEGLVAATIMVLAIGVRVAVRRGIPSRSDSMRLIAAVVVLAAAGVAVVAPGRCYVHYLTLTMQPLGLLLGLGFVLAGPAKAPPSRMHWLQAAAGIGITTVALATTWTFGQPTARTIVANRADYADPRRIFPALGPLLEVGRPGDRLAIWGWQGSYHVYSGLAQGWLGASPVFVEPQPGLSVHERSMLVGDSAHVDYVKKEYLATFLKNRPRFVIDATGPRAAMFRDRERFGLQSWPALAAVVAREYDLVYSSEIDQLYVRKAP